MKTYYLFGADAAIELNANGIESLIEEFEGIPFDVFEFTEGETTSAELLECFVGWDGYAVITEEQYLILYSFLEEINSCF